MIRVDIREVLAVSGFDPLLSAGEVALPDRRPSPRVLVRPGGLVSLRAWRSTLAPAWRCSPRRDLRCRPGDRAPEGCLALCILLDQAPRQHVSRRRPAPSRPTTRRSRSPSWRSPRASIASCRRAAAVPLSAVHAQRAPRQSGCAALALFEAEELRDKLAARRGARRHHPPLRPFSASQRGARSGKHRGRGATICARAASGSARSRRRRADGERDPAADGVFVCRGVRARWS